MVYEIGSKIGVGRGIRYGTQTGNIEDAAPRPDDAVTTR